MESESVTESLRPLLLSDLRLDPCQWEERPGSGEMRGHCLEVDCLVSMHASSNYCSKCGSKVT